MAFSSINNPRPMVLNDFYNKYLHKIHKFIHYPFAIVAFNIENRIINKGQHMLLIPTF